jgi:hypothetical protein
MNAKPGAPEPLLSSDHSAESEAGGFASFSAPRQITGVVIASVVALSSLFLLGIPLVLIALLVLAGVFAFLDAWHAGIRKRKGSGSLLNISPMGWGIVFMGLLIVSYPVYLFSRNRLKTKPGYTTFWVLTNVSALLVLALSVVLSFPGPRGLLVPAELPSCSSQEVVRLLGQVIRSTPVGATAKSVSGHREISYDREANRRQGQCVVHTDAGDLVVNYIIQWRDRDKGLFEVRIPPPELPSCTSREVVQLLEQVIRGTPAGAKARSIDGHREVSYDQATDRREGQCIVHTDGGDLAVNYVVLWRDREKGQFEVRITR